MPDAPSHFLGLCAIAKDEDTILREWVAYHLLIGFEKIIIYDNESRNPVCDILEDFMTAGRVETYTIQGPQRQLTAYNHCLREHGPRFRHLAFFDLDEFLFLGAESDARLLVGDFAHYGALCLNMCNFSSGGRLGRPEGPATEAFCDLLEVYTCTKWILRPELVDLPISPHHFAFKKPDPATGEGLPVAVNTRGEPAVGGFVPPADERARINHYCWRSQQDYEERLLRGDAVFAENPRSLDGFYAQARLPGRPEPGMRRHAERLRKMIAAGPAAPYVPISYEEVATLPMEPLIKLMRGLVRAGRAETALTAFAMRKSDLWSNPEALGAALDAALATGNPFMTQPLARRLVELAPTLSNYRRWADVLAGQGKTAEAQRLMEYVAKADHSLPDFFEGR